MELVRKEAEQCDYLGGFFLLQSLAGGTGSGMGTRVSEALRDQFPSSLVLNTCIWPYKSGEVIVQRYAQGPPERPQNLQTLHLLLYVWKFPTHDSYTHVKNTCSYNTILSMAHLLDVSDAVCVIENEALHAACVKSLGIARPSFTDLNQVVARSLAQTMLPSRRTDMPRGLRLLSDVLSHVAPHPSYKVLSVRSVPQVPPKSMDFTTFKWDATLKRLRQMQMTGSAIEEGLNWYMTPGRKGMNKTLATLLTVRGPGAADVDVDSMFRDPLLYSTVHPDPFQWTYSSAAFSRYVIFSCTHKHLVFCWH